jgi:hypothetical protein
MMKTVSTGHRWPYIFLLKLVKNPCWEGGAKESGDWTSQRFILQRPIGYARGD